MSASMLRLYDYVDALDVIRVWVDEHADEIIAAGGELPPELAELCDAVEQGLADKAEAVALYIRELESSAAAVQAEEERLAARRRHYERAAKGLKGYLLMQLQRADIPKIEGKLITVTRQKSPPSVRGSLSQAQMAKLASVTGGMPDDVLVVTIPESYRLDGKAIVAAWKAGQPIPDGITVEQTEHLRIR